jgi:hypothetical protein
LARQLFSARNLVRIVSSFDSFSTLVKQIEQGTPAQSFLPVNPG